MESAAAKEESSEGERERERERERECEREPGVEACKRGEDYTKIYRGVVGEHIMRFYDTLKIRGRVLWSLYIKE